MIFRTCPFAGVLWTRESGATSWNGKRGAPAATGTTSAKWTHQKDTADRLRVKGARGRCRNAE